MSEQETTLCSVSFDPEATDDGETSEPQFNGRSGMRGEWRFRTVD